MFAKITLIGVFVSCFLLSNAQKWDYSYTYYTKDDGLPTNTIYCVTSDKNGVLWLGTDAGVVKFDGFNMKVFNTDDGLPSNDVFEIVCDSKNRLWLTTFKKDVTFIYRDKIHNDKNDNILKNVNNRFSNPRYFEDSDNNIWIRTIKFELFKINKKDQVELCHFSFLPHTAGYNITEYDKKLYFFSRVNTFCFDLKSEEFNILDSTHTILTEGFQIFKNKCYFINENKTISKSDISYLTRGYFKSLSSYWAVPIIDSNLWVPSQKGFTLYSLNNTGDTTRILPNIQASVCLKDSQGIIWVSSTANGLIKMNSSHIKNFTEQTSYGKLIFSSILVDEDHIYAGTNKGEFYQFERKTLEKILFFSINIRAISNIRILKIIRTANHFHIATDFGVYKKKVSANKAEWIKLSGKALKNYFIEGDRSLLLDNVGILFLKNDSPFDSIENFKRYYSYCEYKDKKVFGSQDSLYYIDKVFKPYPLNIPFNYRAVDLLVKDSILIATTAEKGVFFIHDSTVVKNMNSSNGFSSNTCYKSVLYKDELYTATNKGINIYNFKTDSIFHLFESDGLPSNTVFDLKVFNDTIYAATESGLSVIPISVIPHSRTFPLFANPIVADVDTIWNRPDTISVYDSKPITMRLNALSYGTKSPVKYFFKLLPTDTAYHSTLDPQLHLNNLSHGNYTLQAHALNSDGVRSSEMLMTILVKPYYYQTLLFKLAVALFFILCVYIFTVWMVDRIKKKEQAKSALESKIRNLELTGWKAAFNPHFLFNSIQTMQGLFLENDLERANKFTAEFSAILRKTVDNSGKLFISVNDEITYLQNYLDLEKIKGEQRFNYQIAADEDAKEYFVPTLVLQLVVENSLKHGIQDNIDGIISIVFDLREKKLVCTIQDNGRGFDERQPLNPDSKGIKLIRNKLDIVEKILGQHIPFHFTNRLNMEGEVIGTETTFSFPLNKFDYEVSSNDS